MSKLDSFDCQEKLVLGSKEYEFFSLKKAEENGLCEVSRLPFSLKILLENMLRFEDGNSVQRQDIESFSRWIGDNGCSRREIAFRPARILMQDFTGVPGVVDLAAMRDAMNFMGGDARKINPLIPVDLVIDHSVIVDDYGNASAFSYNVDLEYKRNGERYRFLKWGQSAFKNFRVVPPGTGICHQVNLEYLAQVVWDRLENGKNWLFPDSCLGTDSHTTMVNGLGVLGWGVGGIEAEAAMLGQPVSMLLPEVIGFELTGHLNERVTATDLVLTVTQMLRKKGVVGKFVEFFGSGVDTISLADRATIANMAPEYGATCGFFPIDQQTIDYLHVSGREIQRIELVKRYAQAQGLWQDSSSEIPVFTDVLTLDLGEVVASLAGPKRPEGRIELDKVAQSFVKDLEQIYQKDQDIEFRFPVQGKNFDLGHGDVVIAAITSCTNTSNPNVLVAAGLLARNAIARGLEVKPWVKTSLAPGSQVVSAYLKSTGLQDDLDRLGFNLVGFGCTTCIGNSGPLEKEISQTISQNRIVAAAVLSGNRNFEGRISPDVQANYLASPPLVVAYALAGSTKIDLLQEPLGQDQQRNPVFLRDIWPDKQEVEKLVAQNVTREVFEKKYKNLFEGDQKWQNVDCPTQETYGWDRSSTYVQNPPYFIDMKEQTEPLKNISNARILGLFGDKITTDHISPAGAIPEDSPAGQYLLSHDVKVADFNQYGTRRGNHEVMMRGTLANIRIRNFVLGENGRTGGYTIHYPSQEEMSIFDAAMRYKTENVPLVIFAGQEYGNGSSRDWAAKGVKLLGVSAVIAQSFERIHRSNLIGMGVIPFVFPEGTSWQSLNLKGDEEISIEGMDTLEPGKKMTAAIKSTDSSSKLFDLICAVYTSDEMEYLANGGILHFVLRQLAG